MERMLLVAVVVGNLAVVVVAALFSGGALPYPVACWLANVSFGVALAAYLGLCWCWWQGDRVRRKENVGDR